MDAEMKRGPTTRNGVHGLLTFYTERGVTLSISTYPLSNLSWATYPVIILRVISCSLPPPTNVRTFSLISFLRPSIILLSSSLPEKPWAWISAQRFNSGSLPLPCKMPSISRGVCLCRLSSTVRSGGFRPFLPNLPDSIVLIYYNMRTQRLYHGRNEDSSDSYATHA